MQTTLVIITGHPGTGKTTIARELSAKYKIPFVSKDQLKEHMFDALGANDKDWSLRASAAAHRIMDDIVMQLLEAETSVIVESNFKTGIDSQRFSEIVNQFDVHCIQLLCQADGEVLFERWNSRIEVGERHQGHVEAIDLHQIKQDLSMPYPPLTVPGTLHIVDTTSFDRLNLPDITK